VAQLIFSAKQNFHSVAQNYTDCGNWAASNHNSVALVMLL